eukprot:188545-Rhodomonas_salina.1
MPFIDSSLSAFHLSTASSPRNQSRREFAAIGVDSETTREWHHGDLIPVLPGQVAPHLSSLRLCPRDFHC